MKLIKWIICIVLFVMLTACTAAPDVDPFPTIDPTLAASVKCAVNTGTDTLDNAATDCLIQPGTEGEATPAALPGTAVPFAPQPGPLPQPTATPTVTPTAAP